ncbi:MAG: DUF6941 family protein [Ferrovibrio sp.]|uniref:DUF6941 family protein n=1 Tax=Ferrovibrio sp. TaxID=1917215 RepID=UPI00391C9891
MTTQKKKIKVLFALICDDARREDNGKEILIGVYSGGMMFPSLPVNVIINIWMRVIYEGEGEYNADLQVIDQDGALITKGEDMRFPMKDNKDPGTIVIQGVPISVKKPGNLTFQWRHKDDNSWTTIVEIPVGIVKSPK